MDEKRSSKGWIVLLVAISSTIGGVAGAWFSGPGVEESKAEGAVALEEFKLQRDLILASIQTLEQNQAHQRLQFYSKIGLLKKFPEVGDVSAEEIPKLPYPINSCTNEKGEFGTVQLSINIFNPNGSSHGYGDKQGVEPYQWFKSEYVIGDIQETTSSFADKTWVQAGIV